VTFCSIAQRKEARGLLGVGIAGSSIGGIRSFVRSRGQPKWEWD
jgi:hypothetical protein